MRGRHPEVADARAHGLPPCVLVCVDALGRDLGRAFLAVVFEEPSKEDGHDLERLPMALCDLVDPSPGDEGVGRYEVRRETMELDRPVLWMRRLGTSRTLYLS